MRELDVREIVLVSGGHFSGNAGSAGAASGVNAVNSAVSAAEGAATAVADAADYAVAFVGGVLLGMWKEA